MTGAHLAFDGTAREQSPQLIALARIPFDARGLAFDGTRFWTSHRDNNEIVAFTV